MTVTGIRRKQRCPPQMQSPNTATFRRPSAASTPSCAPPRWPTSWSRPSASATTTSTSSGACAAASLCPFTTVCRFKVVPEARELRERTHLCSDQLFLWHGITHRRRYESAGKLWKTVGASRAGAHLLGSGGCQAAEWHDVGFAGLAYYGSMRGRQAPAGALRALTSTSSTYLPCNRRVRLLPHPRASPACTLFPMFYTLQPHPTCRCRCTTKS